MQPVLTIPSETLESHWTTLRRPDVEMLFAYIPLIEAEFERVSRLSESPVTFNKGERLYNFNALSWELYKDLAFLGLVTYEKFDSTHIEAQAWELDGLECPDPMACFRLLATAVQGQNYENGYFLSLIKKKVISSILKALQKAFCNE